MKSSCATFIIPTNTGQDKRVSSYVNAVEDNYTEVLQRRRLKHNRIKEKTRMKIRELVLFNEAFREAKVANLNKDMNTDKKALLVKYLLKQ